MRGVLKSGLFTAERLRELLTYDPETGVFHWRVSRGRTAKEGWVAGKVVPSGHIYIKVDGTDVGANQLAWLYMTGEWAGEIIDHADQDPGNNRWSNLRKATRSQNNVNRKAQSNNKSGFRGVYWKTREARWLAKISMNRRRREIGFFDCPREAARAYDRAAVDLHGEFAVLNFPTLSSHGALQ